MLALLPASEGATSTVKGAQLTRPTNDGSCSTRGVLVVLGAWVETVAASACFRTPIRLIIMANAMVDSKRGFLESTPMSVDAEVQLNCV